MKCLHPSVVLGMIKASEIACGTALTHGMAPHAITVLSSSPDSTRQLCERIHPPQIPRDRCASAAGNDSLMPAALLSTGRPAAESSMGIGQLAALTRPRAWRLPIECVGKVRAAVRRPIITHTFDAERAAASRQHGHLVKLVVCVCVCVCVCV